MAEKKKKNILQKCAYKLIIQCNFYLFLVVMVIKLEYTFYITFQGLFGCETFRSEVKLHSFMECSDKTGII
jgi:hypothetical protein